MSKQKSKQVLVHIEMAPTTLRYVARFNEPIDRDLQAMARNIKERFLIETSPSKRETLARIGINLTTLIMR